MSKDHMLAQRDFLNGNAAMLVNGGWMETEMISEIPKGFEMRMMRIPYMETAQKDADGNFIPVNWATQPDIMLIPKQAPQKEAAKKFLVYLAKDDMLNYFTKYTATMRPFEYEVTGLSSMSAFTQDCVNIWTTSHNYIPVETGPLANSPKVSAWIIGQPYNLLVYGLEHDGTSPSRWCKAEYQEAKGKWNEWLLDATN
jgi:N-acetylglucosamine transport system substrate-binding protein